MAASAPWPPTRFRRFEESRSTSTRVSIVQTDVGRVYLKALGNPEGPHALAADWIGTRLAEAVGLQTLQYGILPIQPTDVIPFAKGGFAQSGPAFCTREEAGRPWSGTATELDKLDNPDSIPLLIAFDTWVLNRDRHHPDHSQRKPNRDNVFLSEENSEPGRYRLLAIDHSECFREGGEITARVGRIQRIQEDRIYGLFPEFLSFVTRNSLRSAVERIGSVDPKVIEAIVASTPPQWSVELAARKAICDHLLARRTFLRQQLSTILDSGLETGLLPEGGNDQ